MGTTNCYWYGIEGIYLIWHGEWSDPEIEYNGVKINVHDVEDAMWSIYQAQIEDGELKADVNSDEDFEKFMLDNSSEVISLFCEAVENGDGDYPSFEAADFCETWNYVDDRRYVEDADGDLNCVEIHCEKGLVWLEAEFECGYKFYIEDCSKSTEKVFEDFKKDYFAWRDS